MASRFDRHTLTLKTNNTPGFTPDKSGQLGIIIDAASRDPLAVTPTTTLCAGTVLGKVAATGKWKPVRRTTNAAAETASGWNKVLNVDETTMFAVGDVVQLVTVATGAVVKSLGAITAIGSGTITVTTGIDADITDGECWVEVTESCGATAETCCVLMQPVDLLGPDAVAVDTPANGYVSCLDPVTAANLTFSAAGIDQRVKTAMRLVLFV